jgi:SprT protein
MDILFKFLPEQAVSPCFELIKTNNVHLKIVNQRQTKHGDYKKKVNGQHVITVNGSLNKYRFLMTLIHELAHLIAIEKYGNRIQSHGQEWKYTFQQLMLPYIKPEVFPKELLPLLARHFKNPTASSDTDVHLAYALKKYDETHGDNTHIHEINNGDKFKFRGRIFQKIGLKVKRYECVDLSNGKHYLFNANVEVEVI